MPTSRKRKPSLTIQGPVAKQPRNNTPIVISDDSDDDVRQISPPRLTAKQKGKGRAGPETEDPSLQLRDIDVISIPDDDPPILPAVSRPQTPLEVPDHQLDFVKEASIEFEASSEGLPPDQILEQFKDLFFGERKCSRCDKSIQSTRSLVCGLPLVSFILLTSHRRCQQTSRALQSYSTFSAPVVKSVTVVDACPPFSVPRRVARSMNVILSSAALASESSPFLRSLRFWTSTT
jgi:hypothetical protein